MELTILMPCLNEAGTVAACIVKARAFLERAGIVGEVLVADNGSTDGSAEIARRAGAFPWVIHDVENPNELSDKERRSERTAFFRQYERFRGRTLPNGVKFDAIGEGHARQYR